MSLLLLRKGEAPICDEEVVIVIIGKETGQPQVVWLQTRSTGVSSESYAGSKSPLPIIVKVSARIEVAEMKGPKRWPQS